MEDFPTMNATEIVLTAMVYDLLKRALFGLAQTGDHRIWAKASGRSDSRQASRDEVVAGGAGGTEPDSLHVFKPGREREKEHLVREYPSDRAGAAAETVMANGQSWTVNALNRSRGMLQSGSYLMDNCKLLTFASHYLLIHRPRTA